MSSISPCEANTVGASSKRFETGLSGEDGDTVEVDIDGRNHTEFDAVRIEQSAQGLRTYISS